MKKIVPVFTITVVALTIFSCGKKEENKETAIAESQSHQEEIMQEDTTTSVEKRYFEVKAESLRVLKEGDTFEIATKDGEMKYQLQIRRVEEPIPGITSISANIENRDTGLASLMLREGKLTGTLDLYKEETKYRVLYDSVKSAHYLQKILPEEMDELEGGKPLLPKNGIN